MKRYQIQCGVHRGDVEARNEYSAWRKVVGKATDGFSRLARFRVMEPATKNRTHRARWGVWFYIEPRTLDYGGKF